MTGPRPRARVKHCGREKAEQECWAVPLTLGDSDTRPISQILGTVWFLDETDYTQNTASPVAPGSCSLYRKERNAKCWASFLPKPERLHRENPKISPDWRQDHRFERVGAPDTLPSNPSNEAEGWLVGS